PLAEALLFSADRAEHVTQVLQPALQEGKTVILDRYYYSTVAFQGYGHQTPIEPLLTLSQIATQGLLPDVVLLLDIEPKLGLERNSDKNASDSFEQEELSFHSRLREGFLALADTLPEPFGIIDAVASQDEVFEQAKRFIVSLFHD
ncbi:MAG: dTMP kinase, partial [Bdellovibrionales bacterium]|nr:dTMP kinase [Bdellovibrionales bacterium]